MKPLSFLLCIFILPVFGQGTEGVYTPPMTGGQTDILMQELKDKIEEKESALLALDNIYIQNRNTVDYLLTLYDQYKEACYNDSTLIEEIYIPSDMYPFATRTQWIYKQPTFTGFMEFIEEKQR